MSDWDYGRENGLWGNDGIPYGLDEGRSYRRRSNTRNYGKKNNGNVNEHEITKYVEMMKEFGITTIVAMNKYISAHKLWEKFSSIKRENTYASGFTSIGISKEAYKAILNLYETDDVITTHLVSQHRI